MALTAVEERFCQRYAVNLRGAKSAREAGVPETSARQRAYDMLKKAEVQERIGMILEDMTKNCKSDQDMILETLRDTIKKCSKPVKALVKGKPAKGADGKNVIVPYDTKNLLQGCKLLGQYHAMWIDKKEVSGEMTLEQALEAIED